VVERRMRGMRGTLESEGIGSIEARILALRGKRIQSTG